MLLNDMSSNRSRLGKAAMLGGGAWYLLAFFWLPPLTAIFYWLPDRVGMVLLRSEFVMSAAVAATGTIIWRQAAGNCPSQFASSLLAVHLLQCLGVSHLWLAVTGRTHLPLSRGYRKPAPHPPLYLCAHPSLRTVELAASSR